MRNGKGNRVPGVPDVEEVAAFATTVLPAVAAGFEALAAALLGFMAGPPQATDHEPTGAQG